MKSHSFIIWSCQFILSSCFASLVVAQDFDVPSTVVFEGKTYQTEQVGENWAETMRLVLYYPNLPDFDDEFYEDRPDLTKQGDAVTEIRFADFSAPTGIVAVKGRLNEALHELDPVRFTLNVNGELSLFKQPRGAGDFSVLRWDHSANRGWGFYQENKLADDQFIIYISEDQGAFSLHRIPHIAAGQFRQLESEMLANANFGEQQTQVIESNAEEGRYDNMALDQVNWNLWDDLDSIGNKLSYFEFSMWNPDSYGSSFALFDFKDDGQVLLKSLFYVPYPSKDQLLKLYLNATGDVDGEKVLRNSARSADELIRMYPETYDLGEGRFARFAKIADSRDADAVTGVILHYELDDLGKATLRKAVRATAEQSAKGEDLALTKEIILAEPLQPDLPLE